VINGKGGSEMKDYNIPIPGISDHDMVEITLRIKKDNRQSLYRIESFQWENGDESLQGDEISRTLARISRLKQAIRDYDAEWEVVQIYTPPRDSNYIQVLYRKKS
jgi:hypothetical protein